MRPWILHRTDVTGCILCNLAPCRGLLQTFLCSAVDLYYTVSIVTHSPCCCLDTRPLLPFCCPQTPLLSIVSVAGNSITGSLPRSWTFLPWLSQVSE